MTLDTAASLTAFALATSITPGPNNLMLMASGLNHGVRRTIPHMVGIAAGFFVMVVLVGLGASAAFNAVPALDTVLRLLCFGFVGWIALRLARAPAPGQGRHTARPMSLGAAAAFQWVNPKAWAMALTAVAAYAPGGGLGAVAAVAAIFAAVNLPCVSLWAFAGQALRRALADPWRLRVFNAAMAALLVASVAPLLLRPGG